MLIFKMRNLLVVIKSLPLFHNIQLMEKIGIFLMEILPLIKFLNGFKVCLLRS
jgi:hypothetical protein